MPFYTYDVRVSNVPWAPGTTVYAYLADNQVSDNGQEPVPPAAGQGAVAADSSLTFEDMVPGRYVAMAQLDGRWVRKYFTAAAREATGDEAQEDERISGFWSFERGLRSEVEATDGNDVPIYSQVVDPVFTEVPVGLEGIGQGVITRMTYNLDDATFLFLGDSTGAEVVMDTPYPRRVASWLGEEFPWYTVLYFLWNETTHDYNAPETLHVGEGQVGSVTDEHTVYVYNGCASGERTHYHLAPYFDVIVTSKQPDICFIAHGHNQGNPINPDNLRCDIMCLAESVRKACPGCEMVVQMENPHFFTDDGTHEDGQRDLVRDQMAFQLNELAASQGYGFINVWQAFWDYTNNDENAIMALLDDAHLHPLEEGQGQVWTPAITNRLASAHMSQPRTLPSPALTIPGHNYLADPMFEDWSAVSVEIDQSGNGHDATGSGSIVTGSDTDTKWAGFQSTAFDGVDDALLVPYEPYVAGQPFMCTVTLKRTDNIAGHGVWGGENADGPILQLTSGADTVRFDARRLSGGVANFANKNTAGSWETYVLFYDGTDAHLIRNNGAVTTLNVGEAFDATPGNVRIGEAGNTTTFFKGKMQFFAMWANYTAGLSGAQAFATALEGSLDPDAVIMAENPSVYFPMTSPNLAGEQPTHWLLANAATNKDTTYFETGTWSARMIAAVVGSSFSMRQKLFDEDIRDLLGGWATICARVRIAEDEDNDGFAARVAFTFTAPYDITAVFSNSVQTGLHGFKWIAASAYLPPDLEAVTCWLFGNRNSDAIADASWDRAGVFRGKILRDPALLPA